MQEDRSMKTKYIITIIERVESYKRSLDLSLKDTKSHKSTIHAFFKGNSELVNKVKKKECVVKRSLKDSLPDFYAIDYSLRMVLYKWAKLFYSFNGSDPRDTLLGEQFNIDEYAKYDNYLTLKLENPLKLEEEKYSHLVPIMENLEQYNEYNEIKRFSGSIYRLTESEYPPKLIFQVIKIVSKIIMKRMNFIKDFTELEDGNLENIIDSKATEILSKPLFHDTEEYYRENSEKSFFQKYRAEYIYPNILETCIEYLEKIREYSLCIVILLWLVGNKTKITRRDKWFHRLALDLKHSK